jgi:GT2 family glycosyltransferase
VTYPNINIVLIDNASTDGSVNLIKKEFPNIEVIQSKENLGYAGGNNYGSKNVKIESEYSIFINNDTLVSPDFINPLIRPLKIDTSIIQTAPKILYIDKPNILWFTGGYVNLLFGWIRHRGIRKIDKEQYNNSTLIDYATGCCFCIRTKDFKFFNMFDESFSMYGEDVDLSIRIRKNGGSIMYIPESKIWHKVSASIGGQFSLIKWKKKSMGRIRLIIKHINLIILPIALILNIIMIILELPIFLFYKIKASFK